MGDRLSAHIRTLQTVKWDALKEGGGVNDYMELLVKETVTLHKVLSRYLSISVVEVCALKPPPQKKGTDWVYATVRYDAGLCGNKPSAIGGVRQHRSSFTGG